MSKSGPSAFVVIGDTDWWDNQHKGATVAIDSTLRKAYNNTTAAPDYDSVGGHKTVDPLTLSRAVYAECVAVQETSNGRWHFGMVQSTETVSSMSNGVIDAQAFGIRNSGDIYSAGVAAQTGLTQLVAGDVIGLRVRNDNGTFRAQFYLNGAEYGSEIAPSTGFSWRLLFAAGDNTGICQLRVDRDDLQYLPDDCDPWGSAARVADVGGYSPAATRFTAAGAGETLDAFGRTTSSTTAANDHARANKTRSGSGLFYCGFLIEDAGASGSVVVGLASESASLTRYLGDDANGYGYIETGRKVTNAVSTLVSGSAYTSGDEIGAVWKPSTGDLWFIRPDGQPMEGDPEAGTGASFTGVTGPLYPAATSNSGRVRLLSHPREQGNRPAYAEAWDGADLLPEQHFADTIARSPIVRRAISFAQWGSRANRSSPIGYLDIDNTGGAYDDLIDYDLRDQDIIAYRLPDDGVPQREWTGVIDSLECPSDDVLRVIVADTTAPLDVRIDSPVFAVGNPEMIPATSRQGSTITADVCQLTANTFSVYDQALLVTSWTRDETSEYSGFTRTVNPAGRQSVKDVNVLRSISDITVSNGDFANWSGSPEEPDDWTVFTYVGGGSASVTRSGDACVLSVGASSFDMAAVWQSHSFTSGKRYAARITVDAVSLGTEVILYAVLEDSPSSSPAIPTNTGQIQFLDVWATTAEYVVLIECTADAAGITFYLTSSVGGAASVTIDQIELFEADETYTPSKAMTYLLQDIGGLSSTDWSYSSPLSPYSPGQIGLWTNQRPTVRAVFGEIMDSLLCDYYTDADGVIQLAWLTPPEEVTSSDDLYLGEIAEADLHGSIRVEDDLAPSLSTRAEYQRNYAQHSDGDIAGSVSNADRQYATSVGKENALVISGTASADAAALNAFYAHANNAPPMPRVLINAFNTSNVPSNGSSIVDNRLILLHRCYASRRRFYLFEISRELADELRPYPGAVIELTHARYGLSSGKNLMIVSIEQSIDEPTVRMRCWG